MRQASRIFERALLTAGSLAMVLYGASVVHSSLYQKHASRDFDLAIHEKDSAAPTLSGFFSIPDISTMSSAEESGALGGNSHEWSMSRLRAYRKLLGVPTPDALARLEIPSVGLSVMVLEGTDSITLNRGVGHIEGTAKPGEAGNLGIAGHRDSFFRSLDRLAARDEIILTTAEGQRLRYAVDHTEIVDPDKVEVLAQTPTQTLTLVTCYPFYFIGPAPLRYVVKAVRIEAEDGRRLSQEF